MRCRACNVPLDDAESVCKGVDSGEYLDLCRTCLIEAGIYCELTMEYFDDYGNSPDNPSDWSIGQREGYAGEGEDYDEDYGDGREL